MSGALVQRILAALDFSPVSEAVLGQATALARAFGAELILLYVAAPDPSFVGFGAGPDTERASRAHHLRDEHRRIQQLAEALRARGTAARALLVEGASAETILAEARRHAADCIVVGSHGHGALHRALLGSVCEAVLRGAPGPVLVVRAAPRAGPPEP